MIGKESIAKTYNNLQTGLVQSGRGKDPATGAVSFPIYQTATFEHPALGRSTGFDYTRSGNPTRQVLEDAVARLEGGAKTLACSSGMSAITILLMWFKPGDHLIFTDDLYGGTYRLARMVMEKWGLQSSFVDTTQVKTVAAAIRDNTRAVFVESVTNPVNRVADLTGIINLARERRLLTIVDNTFLTPYLCRPLELGADLVVHSATKYLGGHNDLVAGMLTAKNPQHGEELYFLHNALGIGLAPFDAWLLLRGLKTLGPRMEIHQRNALAVARWLQQHPRVKKVFYPGLAEHPGCEGLKEFSSGAGGMVSFEVYDSEAVAGIINSVKLFAFAESLGGVESLITFPAMQTHADIPEEKRNAMGINDRLLRLSVGLEDADDLIADLNQALEGVNHTAE
ncbi:MAG: PLP-dependent transferase [Firmicutes bacterium]|nr:PLP-dependent transferase [Bacillota bacterium]